MVSEALHSATQSLREGKFKRALTQYREAIEHDPQDARAFWGLGRAYYHLGEYDKAIAAYQKALQIDPSNDIAQADLGCIYLLRKEYDKSEQAFLSGIQLNPKNATAYINLVNIYQMQARYNDALRVGRIAFSLAPSLNIAKQLFFAFLGKYLLFVQIFFTAIILLGVSGHSILHFSLMVAWTVALAMNALLHILRKDWRNAIKLLVFALVTAFYTTVIYSN